MNKTRPERDVTQSLTHAPANTVWPDCVTVRPPPPPLPNPPTLQPSNHLHHHHHRNVCSALLTPSSSGRCATSARSARRELVCPPLLPPSDPQPEGRTCGTESNPVPPPFNGVRGQLAWALNHAGEGPSGVRAKRAESRKCALIPTRAASSDGKGRTRSPLVRRHLPVTAAAVAVAEGCVAPRILAQHAQPPCAPARLC